MEAMSDYLRGSAEVVRSYMRIAALVPSGGRWLAAALIALNVILGLLPTVFIVATSVMIGCVPAAVTGGVGSAEWVSLVLAFVLAASAFVAQQIVAPLQAALGELLARRIDGLVFQRLIGASLQSTGIGPLEDQRLLNDLTEAANNLEFTFRTTGLACSGLLALIARYTQLVSCAVMVGLVFSWPAAAALVAATMVFRKGNRGGLRAYAHVFTDNVSLRRESQYYRDLAMSPVAAKEIRVFGLADWLTDSYRQLVMEFLKPIWSERRRILLRPYFLYFREPNDRCFRA
jgi:ATP-binding cassette subfamily B protein